jgi:formiminotetrahydrofolate cyclodeaminase
LAARTLARAPRLHRALGRVYVGAAWITSAGGLGVALAFGVGGAGTLAFAIWSLLWFGATAAALAHVRKGRILQHREWMICSLALALVFAAFSVVQPVLIGAGLPRGVAYPLAVLASILVTVTRAFEEFRRGRAFHESIPGRGRLGGRPVPARMKCVFDARIMDWLGQLADRTPAPGGGAVAALCAASSAALLEMVANYTTGKRWADREEAMKAVIVEVAELRTQAVQLAAADAQAFSAVAAAYALPKGTPEEKVVRSTAIRRATLGAAEPPVQVGRLATRLVALAADLVEPANPNVLSDVGVAAATARAALSGSITNLAVNAAFLDGSDARSLFDEAAALERAVAQADEVTARVVEKVKK